MTQAESTIKKIDPYTRSRNNEPLDNNAVVIGGTSNPGLV